ncbi:MAG: nitroreductase family deazaflavin-dependent oxidoreductase [Acidimicrobiia bacterium]
MPDKVYDSPKGWVAQHINDYVKSNGKKGHIWRGVPTLLLTTRGRKTGNLRRTALIYGRNGASYVVVGSVGGAAHHPNWYLNLTADSNVEVQVGSEVMPGLARTADESERQRLWPQMAEIWPDYANYQKKTDREIPIVIIDPSSSGPTDSA